MVLSYETIPPYLSNGHQPLMFANSTWTAKLPHWIKWVVLVTRVHADHRCSNSPSFGCAWCSIFMHCYYFVLCAYCGVYRWCICWSKHMFGLTLERSIISDLMHSVACELTCWAPHMNLQSKTPARLQLRHDMERFSALLALCEGNLPVIGAFPSQRVSNAEYVFVDVCLNKRLRFGTPWRSHDVTVGEYHAVI